VLERHYTAGGFTHVFKRKGYEWDVGIHYIGEMQKTHGLLYKMFDYVTDGNLEWEDMGEVYDKIIIGDDEYDFVKGVDNFKNKMKAYFPGEEETIDTYVDLVFKAIKASGKFHMNKALPPVVGKLTKGIMARSFYKFSDKTTYEVLSSLTKNERLIKVLTGQYGDYGLPPKESSFYMHASVAKHYFFGGSFPIGGSGRIVETIAPVIAKAGGQILVRAEVDEVIVENNNAVGVKLQDGKSISADKIISGVGIINTYNKLLSKQIVEKHKLNQHLQKVKPSISYANLFIGLNGDPKSIGLPKTNYWVYPAEGSHDECIERFRENPNAEFPLVYISFPAAKDPDFQNRYPGKSTIDIIVPMPYAQVAQWSDMKWKKRGSEYDAVKDRITNRLLDILYKHVPQTKGKIDIAELSTPVTVQHFVNYETGELYGLDHTPSRFRQSFLQPRTAIKNFYLTGQDIVSAGVGGALFAGVLTASVVAGKNLVSDVLKQKD
ncbi:MAG: NAD(P)/FAD-dependent oxidoreductase, partial [Bacteroidota bacterium]